MVPLSLAVATATLTAHAIGAEDAGRTHWTAATGIRIAVIAGASLALAVWKLRHPIVRTYTSDAAVAAVALTLIPYLAAFHVFDALQTAVGFVLRAHKRAVAPTVVYALAALGGRPLRGLSGRLSRRLGAAPGCHRHVADAVGRARPGRRAAARLLSLAAATENGAGRVR